ncbi:MAG: TolC family protein [Nitrospinae bacterium]|nr:TolC family protein [Nitrospinota bacterium]
MRPSRNTPLRAVAATLVLLALAPFARADGGEGPLALTEERCVALALEQASPVRRARLRAAQADALRAQAIGLALPDLSFKGTYTRFGEVPESEIFGQRFKLSPDEQGTLAVTAEQWLFSGSVGAGLRGSEQMQEGAAHQLRAARLAADAVARIRFYQALYAREAIAVFEAARGRIADLLDATGKRQGVGLATRYDVMRVKTSLAAADAALLEARNAHTAAVMALVDQIGADPTRPVTLDGALTFAPLAPDEATAIEAALTRRGEVAAAKENVAMADAWVDQARSGLMPSVKAFGGYHWNEQKGGIQAQEGWIRDWNAGISVELSLFDGFEKSSVVKQKIVDRDLARIDYEDLRRQAVIEARQAVDELRHAESFVQSQEANVALADESWRIARQRYDLGLLTQIELLDAEVALTRATIDHRRALALHMTARQRLRIATGDELKYE